MRNSTINDTQRGKVALVTGASRGIGRAIAERLGAAGADVVVNYRTNREAADDVVHAIERAGARAVAVRADVADAGQLRELYDAAERHYGRLDIVASNVGIARFAPLAEATEEDFDTVFATNARAGFVVLREAANRVHDDGRIVVISAGVTLTNREGTAVYAASKAAVEQLVRVLAREVGPRRITVNSVLPGPTRTDALAAGIPREVVDRMIGETPLGRLAEPEDIADIVGLLAAPSARWITGQSIAAGGGAF